MTNHPPRERKAARVLLFDAEDRILLLEYDDPTILDPRKPESTHFWSTVGGGIEEGETIEAAARRELWEETGLSIAELGPIVGELHASLIADGELVRHINYC